MEFSLLTTFPEELEGEWNALLDESINHVPFLRHEYLSVWWRTRGGGEWPDASLAIVTARQDGKLVGIAPLFQAVHQGKPSLLLLGSIEISDYLDLIVCPEDLDAFVEGLLAFLPTSGLPAGLALDWYNLFDDSVTIPALQRAAPTYGLTVTIEQLQHSPYIPLPGDWEAYLAGIDKKQRHEIRRKMRRVEEADVAVRWYFMEECADLPAAIEAAIDLMAQDPDKAAFLTPAMRDFMREVLDCAFDRGCLLLAFLEINGQKAAVYLAFDYLNRLWIYNSGLDRRFNEFSPGWVLLGYLLRWANENGRNEFDFMRGDEEYKYRFGAVDRFVVRVKLESAL